MNAKLSEYPMIVAWARIVCPTAVIKRTLAKWHYLLCCAPAYLSAQSAPQKPADVARHNCILYAYSTFGREYHLVDPSGNPLVVPLSGNMVTEPALPYYARLPSTD